MPTTSGGSRRPATRGGCARPGPTPPTSSTWRRPTATCRSRATSGSPASTPSYRDRLPGIVIDASGDQFQKTEGFRPTRMQNVQLEGHELLRNKSGRTPEDRVRDLALDGVDAEILFPNKGLTIWATRDAVVQPGDVPRLQRLGVGDVRALQRRRSWRWRASPPPTSTGAIAEIQRCAALGFRGPVAAVQAGLRAAQPRGPELQPARVRAAVGLHRGRRSADHVPRVDRPRPPHRPQPGRRRHQLHRALAGAHDGAVGQHLRVGRRRAPSQAAVRFRRGRHRLGAVGARRRWTRPTASTTCG